jgi:hypothetical protein
MINIILIFLIIFLFFFIQSEYFFNVEFDDNIYKEDNNEKIENDSKLLTDINIENDFNCYIYGCNSSRNDMIEWIGTDENKNEIFADKSKQIFVFNNGFLDKVDNVNFSKIKKNDYNLTIPTINNNNKKELKINLKFKDYTFYGYITNNFYKLQFLIYQKPVKTEISNDQLYEYVALKIIENEYKLIHKLPLRPKIENLETIWINYGPISLGPLIFTTKINFF